jgi:hypothetical protein
MPEGSRALDKASCQASALDSMLSTLLRELSTLSNLMHAFVSHERKRLGTSGSDKLSVKVKLVALGPIL